MVSKQIFRSKARQGGQMIFKKAENRIATYFARGKSIVAFDPHFVGQDDPYLSYPSNRRSFLDLSPGHLSENNCYSDHSRSSDLDDLFPMNFASFSLP